MHVRNNFVKVSGINGHVDMGPAYELLLFDRQKVQNRS